MSNRPADPNADTMLEAHDSDPRFELGSLDLSDERPEHGLGDAPRSRKVALGVLGGGVVTALLMVGVLRGRAPSTEPTKVEAESPAAIAAPSHPTEAGSADAPDAAAAMPEPAPATTRAAVTPASLTAAAVSPRAAVRDEAERPSPPEPQTDVPLSAPASEAAPAPQPAADRTFGDLPSLRDDEATVEADDRSEDRSEDRSDDRSDDRPEPAPAESESVTDERVAPSAGPAREEEPVFAPNEAAEESHA